MMEKFEVPLPDDSLRFKAQQVRKAFLNTSQASDKERVKALNLMADSLLLNCEKILEANINSLEISYLSSREYV